MRAVPGELDLSATQAALIAATRRTAGLLREAPDGQTAVPNLAWTVGETAAHLVTILQHSRGFVSGEEDATRYATLDPGATTPAERSVAANARMLEEFTERDPVEQLVHGLDFARALKRPWRIDCRDAILVASASMALVPEIIDRDGTAGVHATFELRLRGGPRYRVRIDDGTATVTEVSGSADCWMNVDPVAALLLGYGRIGQWGQLLRGRLIVGGRKPWLVLKFSELLIPM